MSRHILHKKLFGRFKLDRFIRKEKLCYYETGKSKVVKSEWLGWLAELVFYILCSAVKNDQVKKPNLCLKE
jgi:hypothetical protein